MKDADKGKKVLLNYLITLVWLLSMGLGGFFVPYLTDNIDFFKIKTLHIEGLETIPPQVIVEEVSNFKNNWLFINKRTFLNNINARTGNAVKDISIKRIFSSRGVELKITVKERKPVMVVFEGETYYFFDEEGTVFRSPYIKTFRPVVYTYNIKLIESNFHNLKRIIEYFGTAISTIQDIYVTNINTIVYTENGLKINMPPLFMLDERKIANIAKLFKEYNIPMNAKEIDVSIEGMAVLKLEK